MKEKISYPSQHTFILSSLLITFLSFVSPIIFRFFLELAIYSLRERYIRLKLMFRINYSVTFLTK